MSIEFAENDNINTRSFEIINKAFGQRIEDIVFIANDLPVEYFLRKINEIVNTPPKGHSYIKFSEIPLDDKNLYFKKPNEIVLYPPLSKSEQRRMWVRNRIKAVRKIENAYHVKMKEFKNIDNYPTLSISMVASYIDKKMLEKHFS